MKKSLVINSLFVVLLSIAFIGCSETDGISVVPAFDAIYCTPTSPAAGDSITLTAHQAQMGKLINKTSYNWTFSCQIFYDGAASRDTTFTRTVNTNYDGISNADPVIGVYVPKNIAGDLTVTLNANYSLSGQTASGQLYGQATRTTRIPIKIPLNN